MRRNLGTGVFLGLAVCALGLGGCQQEDREEQNKYKQYGINCLQNGEYEDAVTAFDNALGQGGGRVSEAEIDICCYKAEAQYLGGDLEGAEETYNSLLAYDEIPEVYYLRGSLYSGQGKWEEAKQDFEAAANLEDQDIALYIGIYEAFAAHDLKEEGKEYLNKTLEMEGDSPEEIMQKGRAYFLLGDTQNAISLLAEAIEQENVEANYYMAEVYADLGDTASADTYFNAYLESGTADSSELYIMGKRHMNNEDYAHAISYFQAALEMEKVPNQQILMKECAIAYERKGDFAEARNMLQEYLELYPSDEEAQREMKFLESR